MSDVAETETQSASGGGSRVISLVAAVVAPTTLITALAYYFGYRRERAFAGFFGIDVSALNFTTTDYVLRSVDALFVPAVVVLLVAFGAFFLHAVAGDLSSRFDPAPIAAVLGLCALILGIALLAGEPLASSYGYLQALGPAVGVSLLLYALARKRSVSRQALSAAVFVGVGVILVSLFWATSEYADSRGRSQAKRLARDILVDPSVTIFSKESLNIDPLAQGGGVVQPVQSGAGCGEITVQKLTGGAYSRRYDGFTLLIRSGDKYFLTPTPTDKQTAWDPVNDSIFIIPDDDNVRIQLTRGADYAAPVEATAAGQLGFTC
jgi:uncharacterized membrane protein